LARLKLNLSQKGLALIGIPLIFEFIFAVSLSWLHTQAEEEASKAYHSGRINNSVNQLVRDIFDLASLSRAEIPRLLETSFEERAQKIRQDIDDLKKAVKDNPANAAIVDESAQAGEECYKILAHLRYAYSTGGALTAIESLQESRSELRACLKRMISEKLISLAQSEEKVQKASPKIQARLREGTKMLLIGGLVLNAFFSIIMGILFYSEIVKRLRTMVENSFRLASSKELLPLVGGKDEISELDISFHRMAAALAEAQETEKSLVEHSLSAICSLEHNGKVTAANPACDQILGYTADELRGRNIRTILVSDDVEHFERSIATGMKGKTETKFEARVKGKIGRVVDLDWSIRWVPSKNLFFCACHDITERKEVERLKQEFLAMVSHDLRTPLSTMSSFHEMLGEGLFGELSERGQHLLKVVERNENRMVTLINDLLDLEKSESGRLSIECSSAPLGDLIDQAVKSVAGLAGRQDVHLSFTTSHLLVFVDSNRLLQVLINLLSNAIKFSPQGGAIKIKAEEQEGMAFVHISDQGRGVPEHLREAIFERFQQVEIADSVDKGGSGLGLAICKAIVELHGGTIKAANNLDGAGATFTFSVPMAQAMAKA
jgi:PAS domain S-box-containing protein